MAIISKLIEGLTNDVEHFIRVYPINPEGFAQSELDGQVASATPKASRLPDGYTELEFIQSTGTQYIDTLFKPNQNSRIVMDAQFVDATTVGKLYLPFGVRSGGYFFELYKASSSDWLLTFLWGTKYTNRFTIDWTARHTFEINKNVATVDDTSMTNTAETFQLAKNLYLMADNNDGTVNSISPLKVYSCQMYDNGNLIRDYVPAKNASGVIGLYDIAGGAFYVNAGSGTFTAGSEVA